MLPKLQLLSLTMTVKNKTIPLDVSGMFNPTFGYNLRAKQFELVHTDHGFILHGVFSDREGRYMAKWRIMKGKSIREKITQDSWDFYWLTD
jgi:hypothetical protein